MKFRVAGIPLWVSFYVAFFALLSTVIGVVVLWFNHTLAIGFIDGADRLAMSWAGRNLGLGLVMVLALILRTPAIFAAGFIGAICRETSDLLANLAGPPNTGEMIATLVFLLLDIVAFILSLRAALQARSA